MRRCVIFASLGLCAVGQALLANSASAAATMTLSAGSEPVESITTQVAAGGNVGGSNEALYLTVKPAGGEGCGANREADHGETALSAELPSTGPYNESRNWTPQTAGTYLLCGWVQNGASVLVNGSMQLTVRPPHLSISIAAPTSVLVGQTFQVTTTAQAETARNLYEYLLPSTGGACPANADAAARTSGARALFGELSIDGGPVTHTQNESFERTGNYLLCSYFEYRSMESPPEAAASASITAVAPPPPCVVPPLHHNESLASVEHGIIAAHCSVGRVVYAHARHLRKGYVMRLNPPPGTHLANGAAVVVIVSSGPPPPRHSHKHTGRHPHHRRHGRHRRLRR